MKLARTVEGEVIPRLLLSHKSDARRMMPPTHSVPSLLDERVEAFTRIVLKQDVRAAESFLQAMRLSGVTQEELLVDILGPTARRLGEYWLQDECSFFDVTMGLCRLHEVLRDFGHETGIALAPVGGSHRILLAPAPGEQHTFGLLVLEEYVRGAGWDSLVIEDGDRDHVLRAVAAESFSVVGLSMSCDRFEAPLAELIRDVRDRSVNRNIVVMVGGAWFNADDRRVEQVGADVSAVDGRQAIVQIRGLLHPADVRSRLSR